MSEVVEHPISWDQFFMGMAKYIATRSKDPSTKCGAVIVDDKHRVVSMGYNGFPADVEDRADWLNDRQEKYPRIVHAEVNALVNASRDVDGCTLYVTMMTCSNCFSRVKQAGIKRIVYLEAPADVIARWKESFETSEREADQAGIEMVLLTE